MKRVKWGGMFPVLKMYGAHSVYDEMTLSGFKLRRGGRMKRAG
jgi:hypothetical protein